MSKYISPAEYSKQTGMGIETIKRMVKSGKLAGKISENGDKLPRYYIEVDNEGMKYNEDYVKKLEEENAMLKATILNASKILIV